MEKSFKLFSSSCESILLHNITAGIKIQIQPVCWDVSYLAVFTSTEPVRAIKQRSLQSTSAYFGATNCFKSEIWKFKTATSRVPIINYVLYVPCMHIGLLRFRTHLYAYVCHVLLYVRCAHDFMIRHCFVVVFKVLSKLWQMCYRRSRVCVCVCVCVSLASDSLETIKVIIIKLGTVTASDVRMHHVLIILTMTFIPGHTDSILNVRLFHNIFKQMPTHQICCAKVYITCFSPVTLTFDQGHNCVWKVGNIFHWYFHINISANTSAVAFKLGMMVEDMHGIHWYSFSLPCPWPWPKLWKCLKDSFVLGWFFILFLRIDR